MTHPNPKGAVLTARYLKDHEDFRLEVIKVFKEEYEKYGEGGVHLKSQKPMCIEQEILFNNGHLAMGVNGDTIYKYPFKDVKRELPKLTRAKYREIRERYLLDEEKLVLNAWGQVSSRSGAQQRRMNKAAKSHAKAVRSGKNVARYI
mgnify:CR=1 FL=1